MKIGILITVLVMGMILGVYAQKPTMTLTFTADNNGQHVPLNSILIENLTQGGDTTLYESDTVLVLDYVSGVEDVRNISGNSFSLSQNYPNPMEGKTKVSLYLPEREKILITVSDVIGRNLINKEIQLDHGNHSFTFYPGWESLYFLTVQTYQQSQTVKMFNSPGYAHGSRSFKLDYNGQQQPKVEEYKSEKALNNFLFDLGDLLKFTAFTNLGEQIITSSPTGDQTYFFYYTGPCPGIPTITDIEGNVYNTVFIGSQCWMKENLKTTTYRNGTSIPYVTDYIEWQNLTSGAYVWYDNNISWKDKYGALYNWYASVDTNGLCPAGWHVPTNDEWTALTNYIGGTSYPYGNELKSCKQVNSLLSDSCNTSEHPRWDQSNTHFGTDNYGFSGLPGGSRHHDYFGSVGHASCWWSSTEYSLNLAWRRFLVHDDGYMTEWYEWKSRGNSIRCISD